VVKISVLPQPQGSELTVKTGDVLLTVVKSAFTVEAREGEATCVRVIEGDVSVRQGDSLSVISEGSSFGCVDEKPPEIDTSTLSVKKSTSSSRTTLPQENALLARALAAESRGQVPQAQSAYRELIEKYPRSAFAQDARAGLKRLKD
jgi:ferric-dicitrate binding protein FerR (iron transport regulator)